MCFAVPLRPICALLPSAFDGSLLDRGMGSHVTMRVQQRGLSSHDAIGWKQMIWPCYWIRTPKFSASLGVFRGLNSLVIKSCQ